MAPGKFEKAQVIADELAPRIADQPGCALVKVFGDESDGECGIFVLWESQDDANQAASIMRPVLDEHLAGNVQGPPDTRLFPVLSN